MKSLFFILILPLTALLLSGCFLFRSAAPPRPEDLPETELKPSETTPFLIPDPDYPKWITLFRNNRRDWIRNTVLTTFHSSDSATKTWAKEAEDFLTQSVDAFCGVSSAPDARTRRLLAERLLEKKNCQDPPVLLFYAKALLEQDAPEKARPILVHLTSKFQMDEARPNLLLALASDALVQAIRQSPESDSESSKRLGNAALNVCINAVIDAQETDRKFMPALTDPRVSAIYLYLEIPELWTAKNGLFYSDPLRNILAKRWEDIPGTDTDKWDFLRSLLFVEYLTVQAEQARSEELAKNTLEAIRAFQAQKGNPRYLESPFPAALALRALAVQKEPDLTDAMDLLRKANRAEWYPPSFRAYQDLLMKRRDPQKELRLFFGKMRTLQPELPPSLLAECAIKAARTASTANWRNVLGNILTPSMIRRIYEPQIKAEAALAQSNLLQEEGLLLLWIKRYLDAKEVLNKIPAVWEKQVKPFAGMQIPWRQNQTQLESELVMFAGPDKELYARWREEPNEGAREELFPRLMKISSTNTAVRDMLRAEETLRRLAEPVESIPEGQFYTPLPLAIRFARTDLIDFLLREGELQSRKLKNDFTLLPAAFDNKLPDATLFALISGGIDLHGHPADGETFLITAIKRGCLRTADRLIDLNADLQIPELKTGRTPLHLAIDSGYPQLVEKLLKRRAKNNLPDSAGDTPLHRAVRANSKVMVSMLIKSGISRYLKDKQGRTPTELAKELNCYELIDLLSSNPNLEADDRIKKDVAR